MVEFTLVYHLNRKEFHTMVYQAKYRGHTIAREVKTKMKDYTSNDTFRIMGDEKEFDNLEDLINFIDKVEAFDGGGAKINDKWGIKWDITTLIRK